MRSQCVVGHAERQPQSRCTLSAIVGSRSCEAAAARSWL